jgi:hypothetical protein
MSPLVTGWAQDPYQLIDGPAGLIELQISNYSRGCLKKLSGGHKIYLCIAFFISHAI